VRTELKTSELSAVEEDVCLPTDASCLSRCHSAIFFSFSSMISLSNLGMLKKIVDLKSSSRAGGASSRAGGPT
jgi:hypothetical protein